MNIEEIRDYCIVKKGVSEGFPFDQDTLVFKVTGKMFLLISLEHPDSINLKCDPEYAIQLREKYNEVQPGYHMHKKYWNTVYLNGQLSVKLVQSLIDHSYNEVVKGLSKKLREELTQA